MLTPVRVIVMDVAVFSDTKNWMCVITECVRVFDVCLSLYACVHKALFLYRVWCSTRRKQQRWRESPPTDSDGELWNGNKASCHYGTDSLSRAHGYTGERSKTAMITDKWANSISQLSLADMLNSNCYERRVVNRESFWILTKTAAAKAEGFVEH